MDHYLIGVLGTIAVELAAMAKATASLGGRVPSKYRSPFYLLTQALLALGGGGVPAVVIDTESKLAAFYLGASAPLILDKLARGVSLDHFRGTTTEHNPNIDGPPEE